MKTIAGAKEDHAAKRTNDQNLIIPAEPGQNVTLRCEDTNIKINEDLAFEWTRTDLKKDEYVFFYRDNSTFLDGQHESFMNRVSLKDPQMKDGDLSVVLKNVNIEDSGTYESLLSCFTSQ
uniref:Ig-like domain-containing protein n=1 Tax=Oryzias melastigma TaxID=30732 RepID=A0A3B3D4M4_ORYME